ncbi:hypothetical protein GCM10008090_06850 [Arenicella chitinivorans]|uniref:Uncharacterized protein n=2 Tax=Arenicella chitinivorans TaxID=1329800 RepID=A0A918VH04_9GAMM|nr:hypothetical protein GCM10008090_06850 [Arenicella chitinivorans]
MALAVACNAEACLETQLSGLWQDAVVLANGLLALCQVPSTSIKDTNVQTWLGSLTAVLQIEPQLAGHISEWLKRYVQLFILVTSVTWLSRN